MSDRIPGGTRVTRLTKETQDLINIITGWRGDTIGRCNRVVSDVGGDGSWTTQAPYTIPLTYPSSPASSSSSSSSPSPRETSARRRASSCFSVPTVRRRLTRQTEKFFFEGRIYKYIHVHTYIYIYSSPFRYFARHAVSRCLFAGRRT